MYRKFINCLLIIFSFFWFIPTIQALRFRSQQDADIYLNSHYNTGCSYYSKKQWRNAASEFERVVHFFPDSELAADTYFYLGTCYFEMKEFDFANIEFNNYLKAAEHPTYLEETIYYKFYIAEHFKQGGKKRYLTFRYFPKYSCAKSTALSIYDEIITTVPNHQYAAASLFSKGCLLQNSGEYRDSNEAFQILIRRFPKHELAPQAYLNIVQNYCKLSKYEFQNPDILALAELTARKFREDFPRDERVETADGYVRRIRETYAKGLYDIGAFYERVGLPKAAAIYYQSSIEEFPTTFVADRCLSRLKLVNCDEFTGEIEDNAVSDLPTKADGPVEGLDILLNPSDLEMLEPSMDNLPK